MKILPNQISAAGTTAGQVLVSAGPSAAPVFQTPDPATVGLDQVDNTSDINKPISSATQTALDTKVDESAVGAAGGVAPLDGTGKVPAANLPSYVDDVLEFANLAGFPGTGTSGIIYIAQDTNKQYRWSGSAYIELVASPGTTDAVPEGTTNLYFTDARAQAAAATALAQPLNQVAYGSGTGITSNAAFQYDPATGEIATGSFRVLPDSAGAGTVTALYTPRGVVVSPDAGAANNFLLVKAFDNTVVDGAATTALAGAICSESDGAGNEIGNLLISNGTTWNRIGGGGGGVVEPLNQVVLGTGTGATSDAAFTYDTTTDILSINTLGIQPEPVSGGTLIRDENGITFGSYNAGSNTSSGVLIRSSLEAFDGAATTVPVGHIIVETDGGSSALPNLLISNGTTWNRIGGGSSSTNFAENEVPTGSATATSTLTLANSAIAGSVKLYRNGVRQYPTSDFTVSGATITLVDASTVNDNFIADYRF